MITIQLTVDQINTLLNALALASAEMEEADGKKEMSTLGTNLWNQYLTSLKN